MHNLTDKILLLFYLCKDERAMKSCLRFHLDPRFDQDCRLVYGSAFSFKCFATLNSLVLASPSKYILRNVLYLKSMSKIRLITKKMKKTSDNYL